MTYIPGHFTSLLFCFLSRASPVLNALLSFGPRARPFSQTFFPYVRELSFRASFSSASHLLLDYNPVGLVIKFGFFSG